MIYRIFCRIKIQINNNVEKMKVLIVNGQATSVETLARTAILFDQVYTTETPRRKSTRSGFTQTS